MKNKILPFIFAALAAVFYALNIPLSKFLMQDISPTMMAGLLYLGAGLGVGIMFLFTAKKTPKTQLLAKGDFPFVIGMIVLDIAAPIFLMMGIKSTAAGSASLLNNFEIVATSLIALFVFKEKISVKTFIAIFLVTVASALLTVDFSDLTFSEGSLLILAATLCWGLENNCTKKISSKSSYEIVAVKGLCSGAGSVIVALIVGESFPMANYFIAAFVLGFVAYGLSIFFYIKAQNKLGAAKTSAFYAINPFIAVLLSLIILRELPGWNFYLSLAIMIAGVVLIVIDTLKTEKSETDDKND